MVIRSPTFIASLPRLKTSSFRLRNYRAAFWSTPDSSRGESLSRSRANIVGTCWISSSFVTFTTLRMMVTMSSFKQKRVTVLWALAWVFVWVMAVYDAAYAYANRDTIAEWEINPLVMKLGLDLMVVIKFSGLLLAQLLSVRFRYLTYLAVTAYLLVGSLYLAILFS